MKQTKVYIVWNVRDNCIIAVFTTKHEAKAFITKFKVSFKIKLLSEILYSNHAQYWNNQ
jgi:hypothetical protein